jgi:hypothetical protein
VSDIAEVYGAGGVECFLLGSGGKSGAQEGVFVAVAGCGIMSSTVNREPITGV